MLVLRMAKIEPQCLGKKTDPGTPSSGAEHLKPFVYAAPAGETSGGLSAGAPAAVPGTDSQRVPAFLRPPARPGYARRGRRLNSRRLFFAFAGMNCIGGTRPLV